MPLYDNAKKYSGQHLTIMKMRISIPQKLTARARFSSFHMVEKADSLKGSLTVEAACGLSLLLFMVVMISAPVRVMDQSRRLQNSMESAAKKMTIAAYAETEIKDLINLDSEKENTLKELAYGVGEGLLKFNILESIDEKILADPAFSEDTAILSSNEEANSNMVYMKLEYRMAVPLVFAGAAGRTMSNVVSRRAWTGSDGGRGRDTYGDPLEDEEDITVYVGKNSTRYHPDPHCHYLYNVIYSTDGSLISELRNASGGKYHACPYCKPSTSGTVYYFEDGTAYHSSEECKAISSYARAVKLSEVKGLGACSYCGG